MEYCWRSSVVAGGTLNCNRVMKREVLAYWSYDCYVKRRLDLLVENDKELMKNMNDRERERYLHTAESIHKFIICTNSYMFVRNLSDFTNFAIGLTNVYINAVLLYLCNSKWIIL